MENRRSAGTLISVSKKTFFQVTALLLALLAVSVILTFIVPKGEFGILQDGSTDYTKYIRRDELGGIPLWKGILAPVLVFFSSDGLTLVMLSLFLFVLSAVFQVMNDVGGIRSLVDAVAGRFSERRRLLLLLMSFLFYCFGAFLGLFEEMLAMLPIVAALCLRIGFDSFTGFLCSILACGFGFAGAITNPFTVLLASEIIGANPMEHVVFRFLIFFVMFGFLQAFLFAYVRRLEKDPASSLTAEHDAEVRETESEVPASGGERKKEKRSGWICALFLLFALVMIIIAALVPALRGYTVVLLIIYFLLFGLLAGTAVCGSFRFVGRSFLRGLKGALPTLVFIALSASVKYVFETGAILPTVVNLINLQIRGHSPVIVALVIYVIVLLLEFFISSSTAKAILVMGLLAMVNTGLSKQMLVLLYTFGDGYTNVIFPTSPVLLIGLSMVRLDYITWIRKSALFFALNFLLVIGFIILGVVTGY